LVFRVLTAGHRTDYLLPVVLGQHVYCSRRCRIRGLGASGR
jgi:hypothetical protein